MKNFRALFFIIMVFLIGSCNMLDRNPFEDVTWIKDYPGANNRYVTYTPVSKKDNSVQLGPTIGADFATLKFEDIDQDGVQEIIIETDIEIDLGEYRNPERHILKYSENGKSGLPKFELISSEQIGKAGFGNG